MNLTLQAALCGCLMLGLVPQCGPLYPAAYSPTADDLAVQYQSEYREYLDLKGIGQATQADAKYREFVTTFRQYQLLRRNGAVNPAPLVPGVQLPTGGDGGGVASGAPFKPVPPPTTVLLPLGTGPAVGGIVPNVDAPATVPKPVTAAPVTPAPADIALGSTGAPASNGGPALGALVSGPPGGATASNHSVLNTPATGGSPTGGATAFIPPATTASPPATAPGTSIFDRVTQGGASTYGAGNPDHPPDPWVH